MKWSVAECFEHLILTDRLWYPKIEEALQEAPSDADRTGQDFRPTLFGRCFLGGRAGEDPREIQSDVPTR